MPHYVEHCGIASQNDPAKLIPELLDRLAALGDLAKQVSHALGGNGHRAEAVKELANAR